jgi:diketogulonate reductase-like aldo/keto reductase
VPLTDTIEGFEQLRRSGKIVRWGVSNFDVEDMEEVAALPAGATCATDQVLYNPEYRGIEFDLLPWASERQMPLMAYSPVGQGGRLLRAPALRTVARRHGKTPAQIALAWALRSGTVIAIPKAATADHVRENAEAADLVLTPEDLAEIDAAFPPPARKQALGML